MIYLAAQVVPGITLLGKPLWPALLAGLVLALVNATVRPILKLITLPLTLVTLGLFLFVLNAFCLWLTSVFVPGFDIQGFRAAFPGGRRIWGGSGAWAASVGDSGRVSRL